MPFLSISKRSVLLNTSTLAAIMVSLVVLLLFPRHQHDEGRILYRMAHYGVLPLFLGINVLSRVWNKGGRALLRLAYPDLLMLAYLVFVTASAFQSAHSMDSFLHSSVAIYRRIFVPFVAYWLIRFVRPSEENLVRLVPIMAGLCLIELIVGLVGWFGPEALPRMWLGRVEYYGGPRIVGTFSQQDVYASALFFFMTFVVQDAMTRQRWWVPFPYLLIFFMGLVGIFLSYSRASWFSITVVLIIFSRIYGRKFTRILLLGILIFGVLLTALFQKELHYAVSRFSTGETLRNRIILTNAGLKMFFKHPLFGWGYNSYDLHDWKYVERVGSFVPTTWEKKHSTSHNTYLTILAETGIWGFSLYMGPLGWWLFRTAKLWPRLRKGQKTDRFLDWRFLIMLWANLLFILLVGLSIDIRFFPFTLVQMWLVLGLIGNMVDSDFCPNHFARATQT